MIQIDPEDLKREGVQIALHPPGELILCKFCYRQHPQKPRIECECGALVVCPFAAGEAP